MGIAGFYFNLIHNHRYSPKFSPQAGVCQCLDEHRPPGWYSRLLFLKNVWKVSSLSKIQTVTPLAVSAPPRPPFKLTDFSSQNCSGCSCSERRGGRSPRFPSSRPHSHTAGQRERRPEPRARSEPLPRAPHFTGALQANTRH